MIWITGWSETIALSDTWHQHLQKNKHWNDSIASVLIFDEAQLTYVDTGLWNTFFKFISDNPSIPHHRIIIFTSYGSPTRINGLRTSMQIRDQQMVTLVPIDHHDGLGAVGLYLTRPEFEDLVNLRKYSFDLACLDFIFRISSGHVGAINDVIQVISCDDVSLRTFIRISIWYYISVVPENHSIPKIIHLFWFFRIFHLPSSVHRTSRCQYLSERSPWQWWTSDPIGSSRFTCCSLQQSHRGYDVPRNRGECCVEAVFHTRLAAYWQRCLRESGNCGLLLCVDVASVIYGMEAVTRPKSSHSI